MAAAVACGSSDHDRPSVVASFYPLAEAAQRIGGDRVRVENLTPPGAEPHDLELTASQVADIQDAGVVLVLGRDFQPAVERAAEGRAGTVELLSALGPAAGDTRDPHVWLDPVLFATIVDHITDALARAEPAQRSAFAAGAERYKAELAELDAEYRVGLSDCDRREILTAHEAFGRLAARYDLTQEAIAGLAPETEPAPDRLAELADLVRRRGVTTIFTETLVSPEVAGALARETGARTEVLDPLEGLSRDDLRAGRTYASVMRDNLSKLRAALGCR
ncbi:MAG TPA: zinc ABC transporter substrate-binding protein [Acidimicrobiales bacterium]|nr:zinc ABC transporter substrate-binding protein [Acidimicrobiales bacterium]